MKMYSTVVTSVHCCQCCVGMCVEILYKSKMFSVLYCHFKQKPFVREKCDDSDKGPSLETLNLL